MNSENKSNHIGLNDTLAPLYNKKFETAYRYYLNLRPLDLKKNDANLIKWKDKYQETKVCFAQKIFALINSDNLDDFVKKSDSDFDNIAPIIHSALEAKLAFIDASGRITTNLHRIVIKPDSIGIEALGFRPSAAINQFPCDSQSADRRIDFLRSRYPHCDHLKLGIIGDDDFISLRLANESWIWPLIIELDDRIISRIKESSTRHKIIQADISRIKTNKIIETNKIHTFITDPPYTLMGALAFMLTGLKMMTFDGQQKEFYLVLNKTMMGKNLNNLLKICSQSEIFMTETISNFSQYELPNNFAEKQRAVSFLKNIKIKPSALSYSSSSTLYIFKTYNPNLDLLCNSIDESKIYEHF